MDAGGGCGEGREAAQRWLEISERLLRSCDLVGSKRFAERAIETDPLLDGVYEVLAVAEVLLAGQRCVDNQVDWYAVLQLPPLSVSSSGGSDAAKVKRQYHRLALLLHPDRNRSPGADVAFNLVADAFAVLSDPAKKSLFDSEICIAGSGVGGGAATSNPSPSPPPAAVAKLFWTTCPGCFYMHLYDRQYLNFLLRCPTCHRSFSASENSSPPPVVPGTDMYYCSWGFFPLGFPGGPRFSASGGTAASALDREWIPFYPMFPIWGDNNTTTTTRRQPQEVHFNNSGNNRDVVGEPQWVPTLRSKKTTTHKNSMGTGMKPINLEEAAKEAEEEEIVVRSININEEYKSFNGGDEDDQDVPLSFHIDIDATDDMLGNLHNLPFLKDDSDSVEDAIGKV